ALDEDGFILTGPQLPRGPQDRETWEKLGREPFLLETSRPGVFAAGDIRSGSTKMVAPAVGDGGMAVRFAAEHLARAPRGGQSVTVVAPAATRTYAVARPFRGGAQWRRAHVVSRGRAL